MRTAICILAVLLSAFVPATTLPPSDTASPQLQRTQKRSHRSEAHPRRAKHHQGRTKKAITTSAEASSSRTSNTSLAP
jgi:hypothetical protein